MIKPEFVLENRRQIGYLRDKFEMGILDEEVLTPYEQFLVSEWNRCKTLPVDSKPGLILSKEEFDLVKKENSILLAKSIPVLNEIDHIMSEVPAILVLSDRFGNVLKIVGDQNIRRRAEKVSIVEGAVWREDITGNNGIGTAIFRKQSVFVSSVEHYWENLETFCCTGTPIIKPYTSEVLGVIDVTCLKDLRSKDAVVLTHLLANQIQLAYKLDISTEKFELMEKYLDVIQKYPDAPIVVTDSLGNIIKMNQRAHKIFNNKMKIQDSAAHSEVILSKDRTRVIGKYFILKNLTSKNGSFLKTHCINKYGEFITLNSQLIEMMENVKKIAARNIPVLLMGESGTGKELVARFIHEQSIQKEGPFIAVNCAQVSSELYASAFFGYEKGAFTGADSRGRKGFFELAQGGTLFLDEIGDMPSVIQAALLRVIETKSFSRLGSEKIICSNCRIVAATNRLLEKEVACGRFREDLYFRLKVASFILPPLRKRPDDLSFFIKHFAEIYCLKHGFNYPKFDPRAMEVLLKYFWKGNVRELKNVLEIMVILGEGNIIPSNVPVELFQKQNDSDVFKSGSECTLIETKHQDEEQDEIILALEKHEKKYLAAKELGISRSTLYRKLKKMNKDI